MDLRIFCLVPHVLPTGSCRQTITCDVFQELIDDLTDIDTSGDNYTYFIVGDLNARTADHDITTANDHHLPLPDDVISGIF